MNNTTTNALSNTHTDSLQREENLNVKTIINGIYSQNMSDNSNLSPSSMSGTNNKPKTSMSSVDKKKMGHREVKDGVVHYKKVPTDELKKSIQFGVVHSVSFSNKYPDRDILIQDFTEVVTIQFPK